MAQDDRYFVRGESPINEANIQIPDTSRPTVPSPGAVNKGVNIYQRRNNRRDQGRHPGHAA